MNRWTKSQKDEATAQGWNVFAIDGNQANLAIQRDDEAEIFQSDNEALQFVIVQAKSGNMTCKTALDLVGMTGLYSA